MRTRTRKEIHSWGRYGTDTARSAHLFPSDDLVGIGMAAMEVRRKKTDPRIATYQIDRNINYTNFCTEYCSFCAFYRRRLEGRLLALVRDDLQKDRGNAGAGGHRNPAAGRAASGPAHRVLRKSVALPEASFSASSPATASPPLKSAASPRFPVMGPSKRAEPAARLRHTI